MSEVAFFVKDVVGPKGCVSIVMAEQGKRRRRGGERHDLGRHRHAHEDQRASASTMPTLDAHNSLAKADEIFRMDDEPDHQELCEREQAFFLEGDPRGPRPHRPHGRCGEQPAHRARRRRERAQEEGRDPAVSAGTKPPRRRRAWVCQSSGGRLSIAGTCPRANGDLRHEWALSRPRFFTCQAR